MVAHGAVCMGCRCGALFIFRREGRGGGTPRCTGGSTRLGAATASMRRCVHQLHPSQLAGRCAAKAHVYTAEMLGAEEHAGFNLSNAATSTCSQGPASDVNVCCRTRLCRNCLLESDKLHSIHAYAAFCSAGRRLHHRPDHRQGTGRAQSAHVHHRSACTVVRNPMQWRLWLLLKSA